MRFPDGVTSDDLYALLGVTPEAGNEELETAWRDQVRHWHPDRNPDPLATSRTAFINVAYAILRDAAQRRRYNAQGLTPRSSPDPAPAPRRSRRSAAAEDRWRASRERWAAEEERARRFRDYFELEARMNAAYAGAPGTPCHLGEALEIAVVAVRLLPEIVADLLSDAAEFGPRDWVPAPWPPVTVGLQLAAVLQDGEALEAIATVLADHEQLGHWRHLVESARRSMEDVVEILRYVRAHPGTIQSRLGEEIGRDQSQVVSPLCNWLSAAGSLRRARAWRSYSLFAA